MALKFQTLTVTTASDGSGTATGSAITGTLYGVYWNKGTAVNGVDPALTIAGSGFTASPLSVTNADASAYYYPRAATCDASASALTDYAEPVVVGRPVLTIASGGDTKVCSMTIFWRD